jgi:hypothetical protein
MFIHSFQTHNQGTSGMGFGKAEGLALKKPGDDKADRKIGF